MKKDRNNLNNYQSPESPRAKTSEFQTIKDAVAKAKKYDELMEKIKTDADIIRVNKSGYESEIKPLKIGYMSGYIDGKIAAYDNVLINFYHKYLENEG